MRCFESPMSRGQRLVMAVALLFAVLNALAAADEKSQAELPLGIAPLPARPAADAKLAAMDIPFARVASLELGELKAVLEKAGWPSGAVFALVSAEAERRLNPIYEMRDEELKRFEFWHTGPDALPMAYMETPAYMAEMARRDQNYRDVIKQLFPRKIETSTPFSRWEEDAKWGALSPDKRTAVQKIVDETHAAVQAAASRPEGQDWARMWQLQREGRTAVEKILNPEELLDYDLRNSPTAESMRNELDNFQPSREEFVTIFRLRHALLLKFPEQPDEVDAKMAAEKKSAQQETEQKIEAFLGKERYDIYVLSSRPECVGLQFYVRLLRTADFATVRSLAKAVIAAKEKLASAVVSDPQKIRSELSDQLRPVLGEATMQRYLGECGMVP